MIFEIKIFLYMVMSVFMRTLSLVLLEVWIIWLKIILGDNFLLDICYLLLQSKRGVGRENWNLDQFANQMAQPIATEKLDKRPVEKPADTWLDDASGLHKPKSGPSPSGPKPLLFSRKIPVMGLISIAHFLVMRQIIVSPQPHLWTRISVSQIRRLCMKIWMKICAEVSEKREFLQHLQWGLAFPTIPFFFTSPAFNGLPGKSLYLLTNYVTWDKLFDLHKHCLASTITGSEPTRYSEVVINSK